MTKSTNTKKTIEPKLRMLTRGFPIWIRDGKLIEPDRQVVQFLSHMFDYVESSGDVPLQATMEVKILTRQK